MKRYWNIVATLLVLAACGHQHKEQKPTNQGITGVDTVVYNIYLSPNDAAPAQQTECIYGIDAEVFIDKIFDRIYAEEYQVYSFDTHKQLSATAIRRMERNNDFERRRITMVQFHEAWSIDSTGLSKKVLSLTLGVEAYSEQGTFLGHRGLFCVE